MVECRDYPVFERILGCMKNKLLDLFKYQLFSGSLIMIVGSNLISGLNYIYHFVMGRLLGPSDYGDLAALFSLVGILGILTTSLNLVIVRFVSSAKNEEEIAGLIKWLNKNAFLYTLIFAGFIFLLSPSISIFLKIKDQYLVVLVTIIIFLGYPSSFNRSILQGLLKFKEMMVSNLSDNIIKLVLGVFLVYQGFAVRGALYGFVIAGGFGLLLSLYFIKDYIKKTSKVKPNLKPMVKYFIPVFLQSAAVISIYSTDLVLIKHFFSSYEAGIYAALSNLGKIIFFAAGPISAVMFPLVSSRQANGYGYKKIFIYSFIFTAILSLTILTIYLLFPGLAIFLLYGSLYLEASTFLFKFGIFMTLFTLSCLVINFYLSLGSTKVVVFPLIAALAQAAGIWFFHSSIEIVIQISIIVTAILLLSLLFYAKYEEKFNFSNSPHL